MGNIFASPGLRLQVRGGSAISWTCKKKGSLVSGVCVVESQEITDIIMARKKSFFKNFAQYQYT